MRRLPRTIDFNDRDYPELAEIFRAIDADIAALIASGPVHRVTMALRREDNPAGPTLHDTQRQAA